jgi:hypothetical protein
MESLIKAEPDCSIGVGYTTCIDVGFKAVDLFTSLKTEIKDLEKQSPLIP